MFAQHMRNVVRVLFGHVLTERRGSSEMDKFAQNKRYETELGVAYQGNSLDLLTVYSSSREAFY